MRARTLWECTLATGVVDGLYVAADSGSVVVGEGYGYYAGRRLDGDWQLDVTPLEGWQYVHVVPGGAFCGPRAHREGLALAAIYVQHGSVVALRDVRPRLSMWEWTGQRGAVTWQPDRTVVVTRVQGAVEIVGAWETAKALCPFDAGAVVEPNELVLWECVYDKCGDAGSGLVVETIGVFA